MNFILSEQVNKNSVTPIGMKLNERTDGRPETSKFQFRFGICFSSENNIFRICFDRFSADFLCDQNEIHQPKNDLIWKRNDDQS